MPRPDLFAAVLLSVVSTVSSSSVPSPTSCTNLRIAVVGEGVIGSSTALAIKELAPDSKVTIFHDKDFKDILSKGIAGLFRIDDGTPINKIYGRDTFDRLAYLWRTYGGFSGVQLVSGHIISKDKSSLDRQWENYGDMVYNYYNLTKREMRSQFDIKDLDAYDAIHYTAFTSEGAKYVPWMKDRLKEKGVYYEKRHVNSMEELADEGFDVIVNCGGLLGGKLAGDGDEKNMYPIRGVLIKTNATWQKHFLYKDFKTFTIPTIDNVYVGTVKEDNSASMVADRSTINTIWMKYLEIQPAFKDVPHVDSFVGLRPGRHGGVRVESAQRTARDGRTFRVVHNYGHSGNGFTLGWGSAVHAAKLALGMDVGVYERALGRTVSTQPSPRRQVARWNPDRDFKFHF